MINVWAYRIQDLGANFKRVGMDRVTVFDTLPEL